MTIAQLCLAVLLMSGFLTVHASPPLSGPKRDAKHSSHAEDDNLDNVKEMQTHPHTLDPDERNSSLDEANKPYRTIIPLDDITTNLDQNTATHLYNVQLTIPGDVDIGNINPDFSRMILNVNSMISSMEIEGDYTLINKNVAMFPFLNQGHLYVSLNNVTITGRTALTLTPLALLALGSELKYTPREVTVRVVPTIEVTSPEEVYLSKDIVEGTLAQLINKEVEDHLNYYVDAQINLGLSKISVFTVGHKNIKSLVKEHLTQNVQIGDLFDELLSDVQAGIRLNHKDEINIPSFHRNFSEKLESNIVSGNFSAEQGWLSGLSTFKRSSNVSLSKSGEEFILSAVLEFDDLQMGYDEYVAMFLKSKVTGELDGHFIHRQMTIKVAMDPKEDGACTSTLNELRIFKVNGYRIQNITNIGSLDWLQIKINNWLIGYFQTKIVKDVEKVISNAVRSSLSRFDCGEYVPSLKILK